MFVMHIRYFEISKLQSFKSNALYDKTDCLYVMSEWIFSCVYLKYKDY